MHTSQAIHPNNGVTYQLVTHMIKLSCGRGRLKSSGNIWEVFPAVQPSYFASMLHQFRLHLMLFTLPANVGSIGRKELPAVLLLEALMAAQKAFVIHEFSQTPAKQYGDALHAVCLSFHIKYFWYFEPKWQQNIQHLTSQTSENDHYFISGYIFLFLIGAFWIWG